MEGLIDLNNTAVEEEEEEEGGAGVSSSSLSSSTTTASCYTSTLLSSSSVCLELWHACAGPLISLPRKGNVVVYLPQGHLEQISEIPFSGFYDLPPHVFCRVVDVKLHAELANDEVYAQVSLVPDSEIEKKYEDGDFEVDGEEEEVDGGSKSMTPHMFCKTLTASDTSTHGGFSVPRRAAEDCFSPLDYKQQRPSQELVAKDLHGVEWKFKHIYRGQPRRHLLTTGWSAFVNNKKLVSGDAVLFLRGENGELRLGVRRASQFKGGFPFSMLCSESLRPSSLTAVARAVSTKSVFQIYYSPRASPSEFVVPLHKFSKGFDHSFSIGARFKIRIESEDAAERRYTGLITGVSDLDPVRWPGSKWRCLSVRWDDDVELRRHNRVSPWEILPSSSVSSSNIYSPPGSKRSRISLTKSDPPVPNGVGFLDFGDSLRFQKVLQGQEILEFNTPCNFTGLLNHLPAEMRRYFPGSNSSGMAATGTASSSSDISHNRIGFGESVGLHKVLQGQENYPKPQHGRAAVGNHVQADYDNVHRSVSGRGLSSILYSNDGALQLPTPSLQVSPPSSVVMFQQPSARVLYPHSAYALNNQEKREHSNLFDAHESFVDKLTLSTPYRCSNTVKDVQMISPLDLFNEHKQIGVLHSSPPTVTEADSRSSPHYVPKNRSGCRLFGFPLTREIHVTNEEETIGTPFTVCSNLDASSSPVAIRHSRLHAPKPSKGFGGSYTELLTPEGCHLSLILKRMGSRMYEVHAISLFLEMKAEATVLLLQMSRTELN
ncbi:hypothetical protein IFM89_010840 [Coptis chinensis]|uniref:Auxin response factor n=1 Tax=Coptis chinensis TaxID=261450 RepID=A0A835LUH8_9MAGN|nr:hypothetical protein IFM89_010840 [Coptis chinensis]